MDSPLFDLCFAWPNFACVWCALVLLVFTVLNWWCYESPFLDACAYPQLHDIQQNWQAMACEANALVASMPMHPSLSRPQYSLSTQRMIEFISSLGVNDQWINSWKHEKVWLSYPLVALGRFVGGDSVARCPQTLSFLQPYLHRISMAGFSRLVPHGSMTPHTDDIGPRWGTAAVHVCLTGRGELHVDKSTCMQEPGRLIVFDSTRTHWVRNTAEEDRVILYMTWKLA